MSDLVMTFDRVDVSWCPVHAGIIDVDADTCDFARMDEDPEPCVVQPCYVLVTSSPDNDVEAPDDLDDLDDPDDLIEVMETPDGPTIVFDLDELYGAS